MIKVNCDIVKDLLPLYIDDACSDKSKIFIVEHLKSCSECELEFNLMKEDIDIPNLDTTKEDEEAVKLIKKLNKKIFMKQILIVGITVIVICSLWAYFNLIETYDPYKNNLTGEIRGVDDVMYYFKYAFFPYIVLFTVVIVNFIKSIFITRKSKDSVGKMFNEIDLVIDIFCGIAMALGLLFQGVLADNSAEGYKVWANLLVIISAISFIVFIANLIIVLKRRLDR